MHELLLFAQVPPSRHNYVLNVLTGLAAMQPQPILEKHLIFKPARLPAAARPAHVGAFQGVQNSQLQALQGQTSGDLYYLQLVGDIGARGSGRRGLREGEEGVIDVLMGEGNGDVQLEGKEDTAPATPASNGTADNIQSWTLQFRDLPEPVARRPVTSRLMADIPITLGDPLQLMSALDYHYKSTYLISGHRLTHLSTSILLYQPLLSSTPPEPLDPSGTFMLQASVRVQDGSKPDIMGKGISELLALKEALRGCVELEVGDRLALDTRVR